MKLSIYTDGASRGNPGPAAYGFVITNEQGEVILEEGKFIGVNTNNFAEYTAVLQAFLGVREKLQNSIELLKKNEIASDLQNFELNFFADSKLVVEQLKGRYKIKSENLKPLIAMIKELEKQFLKVTYTHVPREKNKDADRLANIALDQLRN